MRGRSQNDLANLFGKTRVTVSRKINNNSFSILDYAKLCNFVNTKLVVVDENEKILYEIKE